MSALGPKPQQPPGVSKSFRGLATREPTGQYPNYREDRRRRPVVCLTLKTTAGETGIAAYAAGRSTAGSPAGVGTRLATAGTAPSPPMPYLIRTQYRKHDSPETGMHGHRHPAGSEANGLQQRTTDTDSFRGSLTAAARSRLRLSTNLP